MGNKKSRETGNIGYTGLQSIFHVYFGCTHDIYSLIINFHFKFVKIK